MSYVLVNCIYKHRRHTYRGLQIFLLLALNSHEIRHENLTIFQAAESGDSSICDLLIKSDCGINVQNASGESPLLLASIEGHTGIVNLLIQKGIKTLNR